MKCLGIHLGCIEMSEWPQSDIIHAETKTSQRSPCLDCCSEHWRYFITRTHGVWKSPEVCNQVVSCASFFSFSHLDAGDYHRPSEGHSSLHLIIWLIFVRLEVKTGLFCAIIPCLSVLPFFLFHPRSGKHPMSSKGPSLFLTHITSEQIVTQHM